MRGVAWNNLILRFKLFPVDQRHRLLPWPPAHFPSRLLSVSICISKVDSTITTGHAGLCGSGCKCRPGKNHTGTRREAIFKFRRATFKRKGCAEHVTAGEIFQYLGGRGAESAVAGKTIPGMGVSLLSLSTRAADERSRRSLNGKCRRRRLGRRNEGLTFERFGVEFRRTAHPARRLVEQEFERAS